VEYKYVLLDHSGNHPVAWQQGNNSVLALRPGDELVEVFDNWGADPGAKMVADGGQPITRENRLLSWASEMEAQLVSQKQDLRRSRMELASAQEVDGCCCCCCCCIVDCCWLLSHLCSCGRERGMFMFCVSALDVCLFARELCLLRSGAVCAST
jgi:hypothetical protein